jgi:pilus assembly protein CpaC
MQLIAQLYPGQVESLVTVGQGAGERKLLVRLDFFYVQYERTSGYAVGLGWPDSVGGTPVIQTNVQYDFIARSTTNATATIAGQPLPRLDVAARHGWAKVVKQATVITGNGAEAKYSNGGEVNVAQNQGLSVGFGKVNFGTNLTVLPRYDTFSKDVEVKLSAETSDLTSPAGQTIPGRTTTHLDVLLTMKLGQALILSGIKTASRQHAVGGLPLLSEVPVLGLLFASHRQDEQELEGAIFIVPSIIEAPNKGALDLIKTALASYRDYAGEIDQVDAFPKTPPSAR